MASDLISREGNSMPMQMVTVEVSIPKDAIGFKIVGMMRTENGLEYFEIPYEGLTGFEEGCNGNDEKG